MNTFQDNDQQMMSITKAYLQYYISIQEQLLIELQRDIAVTKKSVDAIDLQTTIDEFIAQNKKEKKPDQDIVYEPYIPYYEKSQQDQEKFLEQQLNSQKTSILAGLEFLKTPLALTKRRSTQTSNFPLRVDTSRNTSVSHNIQNYPPPPPAQNELWDTNLDVNLDTKLLKWFDEFLLDLIQNKSVEKSRFDEAMKLLEEYNGRMAFTMSLNQKRSVGKLEKQPFEQIGDLVGFAMTQAHKNNDPHVGRLLMNMAQTFYMERGPQKKHKYLQKYLRNHSCWTDMRFWESAFYGN